MDKLRLKTTGSDSGGKTEEQLASAWASREANALFRRTEAFRVFHGPGEGAGPSARWAIDRFGDFFWITEWESQQAASSSQTKAGGRDFGLATSEGVSDVGVLRAIEEFLRSRDARGAVVLRRPQKGVPVEPVLLFGEVPERLSVREEGVRYWIELLGGRHPGLFLDHRPLRRWLGERSQGWRVLNTFSYTGSLSVAAGLGGAREVVTLDLSKMAIRWARDNWSLNGLEESRGRWISGDVFEWLPRLRREGGFFDAVILDPPSFSRGEKGVFSTAKDLARLHRLALEVLAPGGILVTSINSANVSWTQFEKDVHEAARAGGCGLQVLSRVDLPEDFPTRLGRPEERYLKGWVLKRTS